MCPFPLLYYDKGVIYRASYSGTNSPTSTENRGGITAKGVNGGGGGGGLKGRSTINCTFGKGSSGEGSRGYKEALREYPRRLINSGITLEMRRRRHSGRNNKGRDTSCASG